MIKNPISYPGNKNRLVSELIKYFPKDYRVFVDVFAGSGVVAANSNAERIVLNDSNEYTIQIMKYQHDNSFEEIVDDIEAIIRKYGLTYTRKHEKGFYIEYKHEGLSKYNKEAFNKLKNDYNKTREVKLLFVLLIYGFNHYLRFNKNGEFNVPVGKVDFSNSIYKELSLFQKSFNLRNVEFLNYDFRNEEIYKYDNAFFYFDPPYLITTAPYNAGWSEKDEIELLSLLDTLNSQGKKFALSNVILSNGKENLILKEWCQKYNVHYLHRQYRNANYQKINVTDTVEVLICNY